MIGYNIDWVSEMLCSGWGIIGIIGEILVLWPITIFQEPL